MYEFKVQGMSCGSCVRHIVSAVQNLDATAKVKVDLATQIVTVDTDSKSPKEIAAKIEDTGYPVLSVKDSRL